MRKKLMALLATAMLCILVALPTFAAKPAVQAIMRFSTNSANGVSPTIYFRNNTTKTMKYIDWYMVPYNAVNDPVQCEIRRTSVFDGQLVGPIEPFSVNLGAKNDYLGRAVIDGKLYTVYTDSYGCPYISKGGTVYLTNAEVQNLMVDSSVTFDNCWYSPVIDHIAFQKVVITYMDGTKQTISGSAVLMENNGVTLQNKPYEDTKKLYSSVYNYQEYKNYNPDLVAAFGSDEHKYLDHFITSGMKEYRRGSYEFNLAAYKANNPDLVAAFGDDNAKYYEHYLTSGKNEGRSALEDDVPPLEVMDFRKESTSNGKITQRFYFRNNSSKVIDKLAFTVTAYDKDGKATMDLDTMKSTKVFTVNGPVTPFVVDKNRSQTVCTNNNVSKDSPFYTYRDACYLINVNGQQRRVYLDKNNDFFVMKSGASVGGDNSYTYLTQDEIEHGMYSTYYTSTDAWWSSLITTLRFESVTITYNDGTTETIQGKFALSNRRNVDLQNQPVGS